MVAGLGLVTGTFWLRNAALRESALKEKDTLCIDVLGLQTTLPVSRYALIASEGMVAIAKDGREHFALHSLSPGIDLKDQPGARLAFTFPYSGWKTSLRRIRRKEITQTQRHDSPEFYNG